VSPGTAFCPNALMTSRMSAQRSGFEDINLLTLGMLHPIAHCGSIGESPTKIEPERDGESTAVRCGEHSEYRPAVRRADSFRRTRLFPKIDEARARCPCGVLDALRHSVRDTALSKPSRLETASLCPVSGRAPRSVAAPSIGGIAGVPSVPWCSVRPCFHFQCNEMVRCPVTPSHPIPLCQDSKHSLCRSLC